MLDTFFAGAAVVLTLVGFSAAYITARRNELRREEVLSWVNEGIACLQTTALLANASWYPIAEDERSGRLLELSIKASILVEQGRLFFKNKAFGSHGLSKEPAYRGIRPMILDELIVIHGLSRGWNSLQVEDRGLASEIAVSCLKRFVSMAQQEVGRDRAASSYAASAGDGASFDALLDGLKSKRRLDRPSLSK